MSLDRRQMAEALPSYELGAEIGRGAFGLVFRATHRALGRQVAVKQLPRALAADPSVRARFLTEARVVASLHHPHIVPVYDYVERDGLCLLVIEYLGGGTLGSRLATGAVDPGFACASLLATAAALDEAHRQGILHRDVKPDNILFSEDGTPKLGDFGIAKMLESDGRLTVAGTVVGTPAYMAPEQATGTELSPATDVYSCGIVLYEALAVALPFPAASSTTAQLYQHAHEPPRELAVVAPSVPEEIAGVVMRCLAKRPEDRFASAAEFGAALHEAADRSLGPRWLAQVPVRLHLEGSSPVTSASRSVATSELAPPLAGSPTAPPVPATPARPTMAPQGLEGAPVLPKRRRRRWPLTVGFGALAVLAVASVAVLAGGNGSEGGGEATDATVPSNSAPNGAASTTATTTAANTTEAPSTFTTDAETAQPVGSYVETCTERGLSEEACRCIIVGLQELFPKTESFVEELANLQQGIVSGPRVRALLNRCTA